MKYRLADDSQKFFKKETSERPRVWHYSQYFGPSAASWEIRRARPETRFFKASNRTQGEIHAFYQSKGIDTVLQLNPGNHYNHAAERTAAGICWLRHR